MGQEARSYENNFKFLENKGQWPDFVHFRASSRTAKMYIEQGRILYEFLNTNALHEAHYSDKDAKSLDDSPVIERELIAANFIGANEVSETQVKNPSKEYYNFFIGDDKDKWASKVYGYSDVVLNEYYDGIDLHFNNEGDHLKYEFVVKENANPEEIIINYENAKSVKVMGKGNLRVEGKLGVVEEKKPYVYQIKNGKIIEIPCEFEVDGNKVTYDIGDYDRRIELVIDPDLVFASYSGSTSDNFGMTATYDQDGSLYSGGIVFGNNYPATAGVFDEEGNFTQVNPEANQALEYGVTDIFISKYSDDGKTMLYSTYLGGGNDMGGTEVVHSIICNDNNELYLFGTTSSSDFPLVNAYQTNFNGGAYRTFYKNAVYYFGSDSTTSGGGTDIIVSKLSSDGSSLLGSTYMGGTENDGINYNENGSVNGNNYNKLFFNYGDPFRGEIMLDEKGDCYVASCTYSTDFPTKNAIQSTNNGQQDGVMFKLNADLNNLIWSTYWGGEDQDACYNIDFDSNNNVYLVGGTVSDTFPTTGGTILDTNFSNNNADGFISKFSNNLSTLYSSTYIGTPEYDQVYFLQINRNDEVFLLGQTQGEITPSPDTYNNPNSGQFIMKIENDLSAINLQTVFGNGVEGEVNISPTAFLVDVCGNIYVSGWGGGIGGSLHQTSALDSMPITSDAYQADNANGYVFYLIVFSAEAKDLLYASYLGGEFAREHVDGGTSRFDSDGIVYQSVCGGCGGHSDFPTYPSDVWSTTNNSGNCNNLVFKFDFNLIPRASAYAEENVVCTNHELELNNQSENYISYEWDFGNGQTSTTILNPTVIYSDTGSYEVVLVVTDSVCGLADTTSFTIDVIEEVQLDVSENVYQCEPSLIELTAFSSATADEFIWSTNSNFSDTLNDNLSDSVVDIFSEEGGYFYVKASNDYCELIDSVLIFYTSASMKIEGETKLCKGDTAQVSVVNTNDTITFDNFVWKPENILISGQGEAQVDVFTLETQYLSVVADASNGCIVTDSILIEVSDIDTLEVGATADEYLIPINSNVELQATPSGYNYSWTPANVVQNPNAQQTIATLGENTLFTVSITDSICFLEDTVFVSVFDYVCDEPNLFVPNAFTPNNDGNNDVLYVRSRVIDQSRELLFRVYNRWGELVFETRNINDGWDGTFEDKLSDPDVYDYYLEGFCIDGQEFLIQGNVTLIR